MINAPDRLMLIKSIKARQIYDSRGKPTIEVDLYTNDNNNNSNNNDNSDNNNGKNGNDSKFKNNSFYSIPYRATVPSGASTGIYEAHELRDNDPSIEFGQSVHKAVSLINKVINDALKGMSVKNQQEIDMKLINLDGTEKLTRLGANSILAVSLATAIASSSLQYMPLYQYLFLLSESISNCHSSTIFMADESRKEELMRDSIKQEKKFSFHLPIPAFNVINGGKHAGNLLAPQELMVVPNGSSFRECMKMASEIYQNLKIIIKKSFGVDAVNVGDEGGFAPPISNIREGLDLIVKAIEKSGYSGRVGIALDVAASEMYSSSTGKYDLDFKMETEGIEGKDSKNSLEIINHRLLSGDELVNFYLELIRDYPIISIEDPFDQDDWNSWSKLVEKVFLNHSHPVQIVGDDLTVTNPKRIQMAIEKKACNCLLLKPNQIGTLTEAIRAANLAHLIGGWTVMVSHRSGETEDTLIADLAVALKGATMIKAGAPCRGERVCKYNRLLRIEEELMERSMEQMEEGKDDVTVELAKLSIFNGIKGKK